MGEVIIAVFHNGREIPYTMRVFDLLKSDPEVDYIFSGTTGKLYFSRI